MNFVDNCTIFRIWFSMESDTEIRSEDIEQSRQHPQECNLIQTPTGKKVYFKQIEYEARFYVKLDQTNFIIDFDNFHRKYDPSQRDELIKIIDSLQPLDKSRLEKGKSHGYGFSA